MAKLSSRVLSMAPSATLAMSARSSELQSQGIDVVNLSVGEPDFNTPDFIKEAAVSAIRNNVTRYSPVPGYADLRKAVCAKLLKENGLNYSTSQIVVSNGAKQCIAGAIMALVNPGDEVIIPAPYWVSYPQMVLMAGGVPVHVSAGLENDFKITPSQLEAAMTPRTRMVILCSPCNPSGSIYSEAELRELASVILSHEDVFVISDEIYEHLNYVGPHASIAAVKGMDERTIIINGVSKAYAMTGWRIGFLAAPEWIAKGCSKLQGQYTSGPGSISQMAALAAWEGVGADSGSAGCPCSCADAGAGKNAVEGGCFAPRQACVETMRQAFQRRRDLIVELAREIPGLEVNVPQGAFYLFPKCSSFFGRTLGGRLISNSTDFAMYLLEVAHVATVAGDAFGSPEYFRMSYATSDENIIEAMRRIKEALK